MMTSNRMPSPLAPPSTGDADADAAIAQLQVFPMNPHSPFPRPGGEVYDALVARAEAVPAERLVSLLDDTAVQTGACDWSGRAKENEAAVEAIAIRKAYLHWLVSAVCTTPAGFERALQVVAAGTDDARLAAAGAMFEKVTRPEELRRLADVLDLHAWDGLSRSLEKVYRVGVVAAARVDAAATFDRYASLLSAEALETEAGRGRAQALLFGLLNAKNPDARWTTPLLTTLTGDPATAMQALMVLELLPPHPSMVEPLLAYTSGFPHPSAMKVLASLGVQPPVVDPFAAVSSPRERSTLTYAAVAALELPDLDSREVVEPRLRGAFEAAGIGDAYEALVRPAVWLIPRRVDESTLTPGGTKLGGTPDLPKKKAWPRAAKEPLTFLGQIDLAEVAAILPDGPLPKVGLLSLFMGDDPDGAAGYCEVAKAIFTPPGIPLVRKAIPKDMVSRIYQAATVTLHPTVRMPSPTHPRVAESLSSEALAAYEDQVFDPASPMLPQLLGYRDHGYEASQSSAAELLLQLPGDAQTEMEFGDCEVLGLYIDAAKLSAGKFDRIWPYIGD